MHVVSLKKLELELERMPMLRRNLGPQPAERRRKKLPAQFSHPIRPDKTVAFKPLIASVQCAPT
jgi:hypothetical protein